jgi:hypothetical protein
MADDSQVEVPEGAAVFPLIPPELNIHPLLLAVVHAMVFVTGSSEEVINPKAADETIDLLSGYLQRLSGQDLARVRSDMECLVEYARREHWPKRDVQFLKAFLAECGGREESH